jgi:YD repeat-containing protein
LGALEQVRSAKGDTFTYAFDAEGRISTLTRPGAIVEVFTYDGDSRVTSDQVVNNTTAQTMRSATLRYDARGKALFSGSTTGAKDTLTSTYGGLGYLRTGKQLSNGLVSSAHPDTSGARFAAGRAGHIFRAVEGHVNPATVTSQRRFARLFEAVASDVVKSQSVQRESESHRCATKPEHLTPQTHGP